MTGLINILPPTFNLSSGAKSTDISDLEKLIKLKLPNDYKDFLLISDGGEGRIGSAYFLFWPISKLYERNHSANIFNYMGEQFLGIGTNGGGECYALDYTNDRENPKFVVVSLGDLDHSEKFIIADSISQGLENARNGVFDDSTYNEPSNVILSKEILDSLP
ncbi:SMI1/KNR4 family protein [Massilia sp. W12]|uniref:SMI1/KNR4 family protein n=1 Tax=Massilia sp. W12 TaxID=3126507 RepID=UPI0030D01EDB